MLVAAVVAVGEVHLILEEVLAVQAAAVMVLLVLLHLQTVEMEVPTQVVVAEELAEEHQLILPEVETEVQVL
jgi:hypothetical protein